MKDQHFHLNKMRYYELTINTKETDTLTEKIVSYLPSPALKNQKNDSFLTLEFYAEPEKIQELEKKLKADSLRYLILAKKLPKKFLDPPKKPKVNLVEIEKKIEEILDEPR